MAAREIKTTLVVDGEKKFKQAINDASKSIQNIGSRLNLATAEFKRDGDAQKLVQERSKALNEQIEQQNAIVKALEGALGDAEKAYGSNSAQAEKWEAQLNNAKAKLANMQSELANNEQGLDRNGKAFSDAAGNVNEMNSELGQLAIRAEKGINFQATMKSIETLKKSAEDGAKALINFGKSAWTMVSDSSSWADDLITLSNQTGLTLHDLQGYAYAAKFIDVDVDTITKSMAKLVNPSEAVQKQLAGLGVALTDAEGKARGKDDIFWDVVKAMEGMDEATRDSVSKDLFGKSFEDLAPLIKAGKDEWDKLTKEAEESGYILGDEQIAKLGEFNDSLQKMETSIETLKNDLAVTLAPAFKTISDSITTMVTKFTEWAQTDEGQKALTDLGTALEKIVSALVDNVDFDSLVQNATDFISGLGDAINNITTDPSGIISGVAGAALGFVGLQIAPTVLSLFNVLNGFALKKTVADAFGGVATSTAGLHGKTISSTITNFFSGLPSWILPAALVAGSTVALAGAIDSLATEKTFSWTSSLTSLSAGLSSEGVEQIKSDIQRGITEGIEAAAKATSITEELEKAWDEEFKEFELFTSEGSQGGTALNEREYNRLTKWVEDTVGPDVEKAKAKAKELWQSVYDAAIGKGFTPEQAEEEANAAVANSPLAKTIKQLEDTKTELDTAMENLYKAGNNATQEEIDRVRELMAQVRDLQGQLGLLTDDSVQYMQTSYELVKNGQGTAKNAGAAMEYVKWMDAQRRKANEDARKKAEDDYTIKAGIALRAGDTEAAKAALEEYNKEIARLDAELAGFDKQKLDDLNALMGGHAQQAGGGQEGVETYIDTMEDLVGALEVVNKVAAEADGVSQADVQKVFDGLDFGELKNALPGDLLKDFNSWGEVMESWLGDGGLSTLDIMDLMGQISEYLNGALTGQQPVIDGMEAYFQSMLENGALEGVENADFSGPMLTALRAHLIAEAAGSDGILSADEMFTLLGSDQWKEAGKRAAEDIDEAVTEEMEKENRVHKPVPLLHPEDTDKNMNAVIKTAEEGAKEAVDKAANAAAAQAAARRNALSKSFEILGDESISGFINATNSGKARVQGAVSGIGGASKDALRTILEINSPSKFTMEMGKYFDQGLADGINNNIGGVVSVATKAGASVGYAFAEGLESTIGRVQLAVARVIAVTGRLPVYGNGGAGTAPTANGGGSTVNESSSIYIDKYNQYSGADAEELLGMMSDMNKAKRRGYGLRG